MIERRGQLGTVSPSAQAQEDRPRVQSGSSIWKRRSDQRVYPILTTLYVLTDTLLLNAVSPSEVECLARSCVLESHNTTFTIRLLALRFPRHNWNLAQPALALLPFALPAEEAFALFIVRC
jgi:hypothetical protein